VEVTMLFQLDFILIDSYFLQFQVIKLRNV